MTSLSPNSPRDNEVLGIVLDADGVLWKANTIQLFGAFLPVKNTFQDLGRQLEEDPYKGEEIFSQAMGLLKGYSLDRYHEACRYAIHNAEPRKNLNAELIAIKSLVNHIGVISGSLRTILEGLLDLNLFNFWACNDLVIGPDGRLSGDSHGVLCVNHEVINLNYSITLPWHKSKVLSIALDMLGASPENFAAVGHEVIDQEVLSMVGYPITPGNANSEIQDLVKSKHGLILEKLELKEIQKAILISRDSSP